MLIYKLFFISSTKKSPFLSVFTWFLILGKYRDGDHCWWRHRPLPPIKYASSCGEDPRLFTEGKIVSKYCNISKTLGGSIRPPWTMVGVWICMYARPRVQMNFFTFMLAFSPVFNNTFKTQEGFLFGKLITSHANKHGSPFLHLPSTTWVLSSL